MNCEKKLFLSVVFPPNLQFFFLLKWKNVGEWQAAVTLTVKGEAQNRANSTDQKKIYGSILIQKSLGKAFIISYLNMYLT